MTSLQAPPAIYGGPTSFGDEAWILAEPEMDQKDDYFLFLQLVERGAL